MTTFGSVIWSSSGFSSAPSMFPGSRIKKRCRNEMRRFFPFRTDGRTKGLWALLLIVVHSSIGITVYACSWNNYLMELYKSQDEVKIIAALLRDIHTSFGVVFNNRALRNTTKVVERRVADEGMSFLTKTLPSLGKAFDRALAGDTLPNAATFGLKPFGDTSLPILMGELFSCVLDSGGKLRPFPCVVSVKYLRQFLFIYYKYELDYTTAQEQATRDRFLKTEDDLIHSEQMARETRSFIHHHAGDRRVPVQRTYIGRSTEKCLLSDGSLYSNPNEATSESFQQAPIGRFTPGWTRYQSVAREARILLHRVFASFDCQDITPRHGPGAVAEKATSWDKYVWGYVPAQLEQWYPLDAFFMASLGHCCDGWRQLRDQVDRANSLRPVPARILYVPKDSRGPRLISCEPTALQWIQQGLRKAIVQLVESHSLTSCRVNFTHQYPNRVAALVGSTTGRYVTLDLSEASDRVGIELVRLLFPSDLVNHMEACRSAVTRFPDGVEVPLRKFAPMGSSLCFPVLALTIWALLNAEAAHADTRERILVYGDDVIVPTAYAENAIELLELFGLKINRDKSCIKGLFRESCGMDAFAGVDVTPIKLKSVWSSKPCPNVYSSWIAYANSFYDRQCHETYDVIVKMLISVYKEIPDESMHLHCPSLRETPAEHRPTRVRRHREFQKLQYRVRDVKALSSYRVQSGWTYLLRWFTEKAHSSTFDPLDLSSSLEDNQDLHPVVPQAVSQYTSRHTSKLVWCWR